MRRLPFRAWLWALVYMISGLPIASYAEDAKSWVAAQLTAAKEHIMHTAREGASDLYISGYVWHAPDGYTREDRQRLNARAYGGGFGKRRVNEHGHEESVYALVFLDSHDTPQPIAGYARQWFTPLIASSVSFGAGYTVALSARSDAYYIPFPLVLPVATVRLNRFSLMTTGLPRIRWAVNIKGSVLFVWGRYAL